MLHAPDSPATISIARVEMHVTYPARFQLVLDLQGEGAEAGDRFTVAPFLIRRGLRLRQNYTGYLQDPVGGDGTEQINDSTTVGAGFSLSIKANLANTQTFTLTDGAGTPLAAQNLTGAITAASGTGGTFQVGSNAGDTISVALASVSATGLGINALDLVNSASTAITALDSAIASVSTTRGNLGAVQNRFESTINNLQVTTENLAASESRIRDTDMALEMTQFTRHQVLLQAGTAMLGQANQLPQSVLRLLQ